MSSNVAKRYQVPKREVPAELSLVGRPPERIRLYLSDMAERHAGRERPSDLLNGSQAFLAGRDPEGRLRLIARDALVVASVPIAEEHPASGAPETDGGDADLVTVTPVEILFDDGTRLTGQISYSMPEGRRRLKDFLNRADRFFGVWDGGTVHLVNRDRIVSISPL